MEDQTLMEMLKKLKEIVHVLDQRMTSEYMSFVSLKGETTRQNEINLKLKEQNRVAKEQIDIAKMTAKSIVDLANEEAIKIKQFSFQELEQARQKNKEAQEILDSSKIKKMVNV